MKNGKNSKVLLGSGLLLAFTSSLCCIVPLLAILGGAGGTMAAFSWAAPLRPYLLAATAVVLAFAFYQAYKPKPKDACGCVEEKKSWLQSKSFLWIVTVVSILLSAFPYYEKYFHSQAQAQTKIAGNESHIQQATLHIAGMSCDACEGHVNNALLQKKGVIQAKTFYAKGISMVTYDSTQVSIQQLATTIEDETGYKVLP
ncbi:MAG: mercuric transport protein MerTP [Chitinophaga sp.]|uniref:mercuric transport protein MerTP n=1 Tax=Chitinophaga sp. TaxID=1869181 RepID=UPI0025C43606|nr:mercuric transport protein MerTP [Chitinophaga sp.]MBV8256028.1 mercuric transport protein MerTP [Chitinophaga sp.]